MSHMLQKLKWKKAAAIAAPVVMALAATPADAKVLLMGDGGWEVSFDGLVNGFYSYTDTNKQPARVEGYSESRVSAVLQEYDGKGYSNITTGLLPVVWGMNIKAPTTNGLDMSARLGIYPNIQNAHTKNAFGAQVDLREAFFEVGGSFGSVLVGRTLSLYQGKNILTDMTLFGVGAPSGGAAGTTLGRIGYGYVYPQFNAAIRYSTPDINGLKASAGIYQPSRLVGGGPGGTGLINPTTGDTVQTDVLANFAADTGNAGATDAQRLAAIAATNPNAPFSAGTLETPRFEGEVSFATDLGGASLNSWVSGMYQKAETDTVKAEAWGTAGGLQVGVAGLTLTASGYWGEGLGTTLMLDLDGFDANGKGRRGVGYLGQATYAFGQGTNIGVSYGLNRQFNTADDTRRMAGIITEGENVVEGVINPATVLIKEQALLDVMIWHEINPNLWIVGEWGRTETEWQDSSDAHANTFSVGGFFFW